MSVYEKIAQLGITLPEVTPPVAAFVPFVRSGNQIFVSGHIAKENGKPWVGQLGLNITTETRKQSRTERRHRFVGNTQSRRR